MSSTPMLTVLDEDRHWWFASRTRAILTYLDRYVGPGQDLQVLDVGCGTGTITEEIAARTQGQVIGIDIDPEAVAYAHSRGGQAEYRLGDAHALPFDSASAAAVERFQAASTPQAPAEPGLGPGPVLEAGSSRKHLERLLVELKHHLAGEGRDFASLAALVATLGSLDAQLASPRPRTTVLRACLEALAEDCRAGGETAWAARLGRLLERP